MALSKNLIDAEISHIEDLNVQRQRDDWKASFKGLEIFEATGE